MPERITRRFTSREFSAWNVSDSRCVEALGEQGRHKEMQIYIPEFFRRCPSSQRRRPILQFAKCTVRVLKVSYETIITNDVGSQSVTPSPGGVWPNLPGWVMFLPLAATQRATFSSSSAFPPLPSTARGVTVSLPSHFTKR